MKVSVPGNSYQMGDELTVEIEGGHKNAVIYPVLVRYTNGTNSALYPPTFSTWYDSNIKRLEIDGKDHTDQCCAYDGITNNIYGYNDNLRIGHFCLCEFPQWGGTRTLNFNIEESGNVYWTRNNNDYGSYMSAQEFYGEADFFRVFIVDPFLDEDGIRGEYCQTLHPTQHNTICMSETFFIF